jgi:putative Holliday junction resolvase
VSATADQTGALTPSNGIVSAARGTVLGVDYGERRLGIAVGELSLGIAHPLVTLQADSDRMRLQLLEPLMQEWKPVLVVVGLPVHMDDRPHALGERCRRFAQKLARRFGVQARTLDERLTSHAAEQALAEAGVPAYRRKQVLDQVAAQAILETFFETHDHAA